MTDPFLLQLHCGERPDPELMTDLALIKPAFNNKPEGPGGNPHQPRSCNAGLWTSTYTPDDKHQSDWIRWCIDESFGNTDQTHWLLEVDPGANVLRLQSKEDYDAICREYSIRYKDYKMVLDWQRIAREYDAFHLGEDAVWPFRHMDEDKTPEFYCWDAESTVWFNWRFTKVTPVEPTPRIIWEKYYSGEQRRKILAAIEHVPGAVDALVDAFPEFREAMAEEEVAS